MKSSIRFEPWTALRQYAEAGERSELETFIEAIGPSDRWNNTRERALKADLPDAATDAIVEVTGSHEQMATRLLSDEGARDIFLGLVYEILRRPDGPSLPAGRNRTSFCSVGPIHPVWRPVETGMM